jgi:DNA anti-recombination protein RmuC
MPLGLILLALALVLMAVFFGLLLTVQFRLVAIHRRHAAELRSHRELAENAEASRFTLLQQYLQTELASLKESQRASEQRMHEEILAMSNTVAACIGEIDERLERQWPSPAAQQP